MKKNRTTKTKCHLCGHMTQTKSKREYISCGKCKRKTLRLKRYK